MSSIPSAGLPEIRNIGLEQPSETLPTDSQNPEGHHPDFGSSSPEESRQALSGLSQDFAGEHSHNYGKDHGVEGHREHDKESRADGHHDHEGHRGVGNHRDHEEGRRAEGHGGHEEHRGVEGHRGGDEHGKTGSRNGGSQDQGSATPTTADSPSIASGAQSNNSGASKSAPAQPAVGGVSGASGSSGASGANELGPNVPSVLQSFVQEINAAAKQTGVPAALIGAQILQESGGNPNAVTTNPALGLADTGLMQVDSATFQGLQQQYPSLLGGKSVSDPATNIMAGALLDAQLLQQNGGNVSSALTAYNGAADPNYVNEVTAKMTALQNGTPVPGGFS